MLKMVRPDGTCSDSYAKNGKPSDSEAGLKTKGLALLAMVKLVRFGGRPDLFAYACQFAKKSRRQYFPKVETGSTAPPNVGSAGEYAKTAYTLLDSLERAGECMDEGDEGQEKRGRISKEKGCELGRRLVEIGRKQVCLGLEGLGFKETGVIRAQKG